jgi:hypothetical protein
MIRVAPSDISMPFAAAAIAPSIEPPELKSMKGKLTLLKKVSPMWRTLARRQRTRESPSV